MAALVFSFGRKVSFLKVKLVGLSYIKRSFVLLKMLAKMMIAKKKDFISDFLLKAIFH